jgi:hypothetical protein
MPLKNSRNKYEFGTLGIDLVEINAHPHAAYVIHHDKNCLKTDIKLTIGGRDFSGRGRYVASSSEIGRINIKFSSARKIYKIVVDVPKKGDISCSIFSLDASTSLLKKVDEINVGLPPANTVRTVKVFNNSYFTTTDTTTTKS